MPPLLLDSLEIQGYRLLERLSIPHLGRVNLITGKNNAGKSSLLEALRLYSHRGSLWTIWEILSSRGEMIRSSDSSSEMAADWRRFGFQNLFHGRGERLEVAEPIRIGPQGAEDKRLSIAFSWA